MLGGPSALTSRTAVVGGGDAKEHHTLLMVLLQRCTPRQAGWVALGTLAQAFYEQEGAKDRARYERLRTLALQHQDVQAGEMLETGVIVARAHFEPDAMNSPLFARLTGSGRLVAQNLFKASRPPPPTYGPAEMPPGHAASQPGPNVPIGSQHTDRLTGSQRMAISPAVAAARTEAGLDPGAQSYAPTPAAQRGLYDA